MKNMIRPAWGLVLGFFLMANESCEQAQTRRQLKKRVDLGRVEAPIFSMPGQEKLDLSWGLNTIFSNFSGSESIVVRKATRATLPNGVQQASLAPEDVAIQMLSQRQGFIELQNSPSAPSCVQDMPVAVLSGAAFAFEFTGAFSGTFGFRSVAGQANQFVDLGKDLNVAAKVKVDFYSLSALYRVAPFFRDGPVRSAVVDGKTTKTQISADIDFGGIFVNPSRVFEVRISDAIQKSVDGGFKSMVSILDDPAFQREYFWRAHVSRVLQSPSATRVEITAGRETGLCEGDLFDVYNLEHRWAGRECESEYRGYSRVPSDSAPVARVRVLSVGSQLSQAVLEGDLLTDRPIQIGAEVVVKALANKDSNCRDLPPPSRR